MDPSLIPFFRPTGIAVVGASADPAKLGHGVARNLLASGFPGAIHFVNPSGGELLGRPVHRSLAEVPDPVDLAVLLVPARVVAETLGACSARGVRAVVVGSGGFRETGTEGAALEREAAAAARTFGLRLMGPNCVGVLDTHVPFDTTFLPPPLPRAGSVAFLSQSGALCASVIDWANGAGLGLSRLVSVGNEADLAIAELLPAVAEDPDTNVVAMYLEGVGGRRLFEATRDVASRVPVLALKAGRSAGGRRAAASHTGAMVRDDTAFDAACRHAGVQRVGTAQELLDGAAALAWCPPLEGRAVALLTNAGGPGVLATDALEPHGLALAELGDRTRAQLRELLPPAASVANPVDMLAAASPVTCAACLKVLVDDAAIDAVIVLLPPPPSFPAAAFAAAIAPLAREARKPVVVALCGGPALQEAAAVLSAARVAWYATPERAAAALGSLAQRRAALAALHAEADPPADGVDVESARRALADGWTVVEATAAAKAAGIAVQRVVVACHSGEAAAAVEQMGGAVALKVVGPQLSHKTDVGGVVLDVRGPQAAAGAFERMMRAVKQARPGVEITGVAIQPMAPDGLDLIVGVTRDPDFGPLVMIGGGGTTVEGDRDVAFLLPPFFRGDVDRALDETRAGRLLRGGRGRPALDRAATVDTVRRLVQLALALPEVLSIEINPLRVFEAGKGARALDVRVVKA